MKILKKQKLPNNHIGVYLFGLKIFDYKQFVSKFDKIYARRFKGLTDAELKYCLKYQFKKYTGRRLHIENPETFNEKLQWLKLYYRNPLMTQCADKVAVRDYIAKKIGAQYLIPCIGVYNSPDDIDFENMPDKFVLKINWGSGQNIIIKDKSKMDVKDIKQKLTDWMCPESNHYFNFFEWGYKDIPPKIIAEKYIEQMDGNLLDYKFFCFNGVPKYCEIDIDRFTDHKRCFYDMEFNKQPFTTLYPLYKGNIVKPAGFSTMKKIAKILSSGFPHVRVDLFMVDDKIYFGEMTFCHGAGHEKFEPEEWNKKLGDLLVLPKDDKYDYIKKSM